MDFQFIIPSSNDELLNSEGDSYYVKQVLDPQEIPEQLRLCKREALSGSPFYIFDHFDTYFSVIENAKDISIINVLRSHDLLYLTVDKLCTALASFLNVNDNNTSSDRNSYLNLLKMTLFLMTGTVKALDHIVHQNEVSNGQKKGKGRNQLEAFEGQDWEGKRVKFLVQMYNVIQLPLEHLWIPPVVEENFINMICDAAYRTLEIYTLKERHIGETVFQILGTAIKRYNHAMVFPVRIHQILKASERSLSPIANGVYLLYEEFGIATIFNILIKDIIDTLSVDAADTQISRNFSTFLTELGSIAPKLLIPHLSTLGDELLNLESHVLRNCVLQIMGDVITCELTSEDLTDELKEIRNEFLEDLLAHINDVSAHVRSKVLQIWSHMKEQNAVPLIFQHRVLRTAVERLEDKTSSVRKNAVILIKSFLERNPFAAKLTLAELKRRYEEETEKLERLRTLEAEKNQKAAELDKHWETVIPEILPIVQDMLTQNTQEIMNSEENFEDLVKRISDYLTEKKYKEAVALARQADYVAGNSDLRSTLRFEEQCVYYITLLKSYLCLNSGCKDIDEELVTQENTVKFLEDSIEFSKIITKAVPKLLDMLMSKTNTDVFEAVDFFTTAYLFGIKGTESGMQRMLYLVWSGDKEKRDSVLNAYKRVLFTTDLEGRAHAVKVVKNLCTFLQDLTYGHYTAMEVLIREWVENGDIDPQIIQVLFEHFTMKTAGITENDSRLALQLLVMSSSAKSSITNANINIIETIGFEDRGRKDPRIYCGCLSFLLNSVPGNLKSKFYKRYDDNHSLVQKSLSCFLAFFFHPEIHNFDDITIKTVEFLYQLCQAPDVICQSLIIDLLKKLKSVSERCRNIHNSQCSQISEGNCRSSQSEDETGIKYDLPIFLVTRFIHFVGYVTMKELIFLDIDVYNNMKYRQDLKEEKNNLNKKKHNKRKTVHLDMSASETLKKLTGTAAEPQQEPDEDLVGATAEDSIAELILHICENDLLYSSEALLTKIVPAIIDICKYPGRYPDPVLQQAACLALIRFMSVSSKFCEANMPFLMNILHQTKNIKIKCNIVVGLSDLTFRFPNVLEPWTGHFYAILHERNDELRLTAVKMLSHLILHEMIRVKGQIADLAMGIVDGNEEIRNITQQFFKEIANKSNILYNVLPDIISKLSDVNLNIEEEKYHIIMSYILGLIQKDRQVESLVEKLCLRFRVTNEERQWRDIAFCLSLLTYSEKTIKKLIDNIQNFKDKVQVEEVHQAFKTIISNTAKLAKPELKTVLAEFETRLAECFEVRDDNDDVQQRVSQETDNNKAKKKMLRKKNNRRRKSSSSESSSDENRCRGRTNMAPIRTSLRAHQKKAQVIQETDSSEEDVPQRKKGRAKRLN